MTNYLCTHHVLTSALPAMPVSVASILVEYSTPQRELCITINSIHDKLTLLDEGSEIVVIRENIWRKSNVEMNAAVQLKMQIANGDTKNMIGCLKMLKISIDDIKMWAHVYVIKNIPYHLLLSHL